MVKKVTTKQLILIIIAIITIAIFGLYRYNQTLNNYLSKNIYSTLEEILQQQQFNFTSEISAEIKSLKSIATTISHSDEGSDATLAMLKEVVVDTNFEYLILADLQGVAVATDGQKINVKDRAYFKRALTGETLLSEPIESLLRDAIVMPIATPIDKDGEVIGVLIGSYPAEKLSELFLPSFEGKGYVYVVDNEGEIITRTTNAYTLLSGNNYLEQLSQCKFYQLDAFETVRSNLYLNKGGLIRYEYNGEKRLASYNGLGINDWNIFTMVPEDVITEYTSKITTNTAILAIVIMLCFILFLLYILIMQNKADRMQKKHIDELTNIAYYDELTGAPNLAKFKIEAQRLLEENINTSYILMKLDVENFKLINDIFGFGTGDKILNSMKFALENNLQNPNETYAKVGVDEFVILHQFISWEQIYELRRNFIKNFYETMGKDFTYQVAFPLGQYVIKFEEMAQADIISMFEKANFAHRMAKQDSKEKVVDFDANFKDKLIFEKELEGKMDHALATQQFKVFLQPKYYLKDETIAGAEALVRWKFENQDITYPDTFIPLFEKNGFIIQLDLYMFENTCKIIRGWIDSGLTPVTISVNFSRLHLSKSHFVQELCEIADRYEVPRKLLEIELTETVILESEEILLGVLSQIHDAGFTISMDDFGSGYSSLGLLQNLPVDVVKLDKSFFEGLYESHQSKIVIGNVIKMLNELKIKTVAEGVETKEQIDLLMELNCDIVQGYYYSRPIPAEDLKLTS